MGVAAIYERDGDRWVPGPEAKGPFPGQHGGAVAGVLAASLEAEAARLGAGIALQCSTVLLRPAPVEPCVVSVSTVRAGGRVTVLSAALSIGDKGYALGQAIFVRPQDVGHWPLPETTLYEPSDAELFPRRTKSGSVPWFRDTVEIRQVDGTFWLRSVKPLLLPPSPMARVCTHADWASGLSRRDTLDSPMVAGFPNADLSVHLGREPRGEWVGLRPRSAWYANGMGMADTEILDIYGSVGRACHTLILVPMESRA